MSQKFIVAISQHRVLGSLLLPCIVEYTEGTGFYVIKHVLNETNDGDFNNLLPEGAERLIQLSNEYQDNRLRKSYSREKSVKDFYDKITEEKIRSIIVPFVERKMVEMFNLIVLYDLPLYRKDKKFNNIYEDDRIKLNLEAAHPVFNFHKTEEELTYHLSLRKTGKELSLTGKKGEILTNDPCWIILENNLHFIQDLDGKKLVPFFKKRHILVPPTAHEKYFETFILNSISRYEVNASGFEIREVEDKIQMILSLEEDLGGKPCFISKFRYGSRIFMANQQVKTFVSIEKQESAYGYKKYTRNQEVEESLRNILRENELFSEDQQHFHPKDAEDIYAFVNWLNLHKAKLEESGIEVSTKFYKDEFYTGSYDLSLSFTKQRDWFDVHAIVKIGEFEIPFLKFRKYILDGERRYKLPNGSFFILPLEWFAQYRDLFAYAQKKGDEWTLSNHHYQVVERQHEGFDQSYKEAFEKLSKPEEDKFPLPKGLNASLRSYQNEGYAWLRYLQINAFGGCLADDMGLGKTLQTLTLLLYTAQNFKATKEKIKENQAAPAQMDLFGSNESLTGSRNKPTNLIIAPLSLVHNWEQEIRKFTPELRVYKHTGISRAKKAKHFDAFDIILTTYGVIRNDYEMLSAYPFYYVVLDESQAIKNPSSKIYKAVCELESEHKLVLTGTPIENSLTDLWAQLNFLNHGLLGNMSFFKDEFVYPIEKLKDEDKQEKLQNLISPFILRRTKQEVAKDLPPKSEQIIYCEMSEAQAKLYDEEKSSVRNSILESIETKGVEGSGFQVLQALTRLRQMANHPVLAEDYFKGESGKFNEVMRHLESLEAENHKVLIFSSFVKHLELFEKEFEKRNWGFAKLTGASQKRQDIIKEFQEDKNKKLFLISLKAGGVGLNLTQADYVFILDPWWNPAAEEQAVNRAHRIGQDKNVFIYRFISNNSIEKKIRDLQERKSELAGAFINNNNPLKGMDVRKIKELFE